MRAAEQEMTKMRTPERYTKREMIQAAFRSAAILLAATSLGVAGARAQEDGKQSWEGLWRATEVPQLALRIDALPDGRLILLEADPEDRFAFLGDIIGEARPTVAGEWSGRHMWGGRKTGNRKWGENGGLFLRRVSDTELFVQYRDSVYTDGWSYKREP